MDANTHAEHHAHVGQGHQGKGWYDKWYKILLIIPVILLIACAFYIFTFYQSTGDFILKDASLSGGTTVTLRGDINTEVLETSLKAEFENVYVRKVTELRTGKP